MKYVEKYFDHLRSRRLKESSIDKKRLFFSRLEKYLETINITDEKNINEKDILNYFNHLKATSDSHYLYYGSAHCFKEYFKYLESEKIIFISPLTNFIPPKRIYKLNKTLDQEEIKQILVSIDTSDNTGIRLRAIIELLYSTSIRPLEANNLKISDIDYAKETIFIREGKGKKDRVVPIGKKALFWLKKYIDEVRPNYLKDKSIDYIFISHLSRNKKIDCVALYKIIYYAIKKYNWPKFNLYSLRISSSTHLLENGMGILHIKKLLGHESVNTTRLYLRIDILELKKKLDKCHPRNKFK